MTIAKNPKRHRSERDAGDDAKAEAFISGAGAQAETPTKPKKVMTTLRFDPQLLERIDAAAARHGISRAAWINYKLARALDADEES